MLMFVLSITVTFIIAVILGRIFIPVLKSIKMGQKILDMLNMRRSYFQKKRETIGSQLG